MGAEWQRRHFSHATGALYPAGTLDARFGYNALAISRAGGCSVYSIPVGALEPVPGSARDETSYPGFSGGRTNVRSSATHALDSPTRINQRTDG